MAEMPHAIAEGFGGGKASSYYIFLTTLENQGLCKMWQVIYDI